MKLSYVRPSVRPSVHPSVCCVRPSYVAPTSVFAAVGPAGRRYRSIAAQPAYGGRMRAVPRCQRM